jgi:hypothetical protein
MYWCTASFNQASGATLFARGGKTESSFWAGDGSQSYQVSASWLNRLEREDELTVNKLIVLTDIYNLSIERLIRTVYPEDVQPLFLRQLSRPNATMLLTEGPLGEQAEYLLPDKLSLGLTPDETTLLAAENSSMPAPIGEASSGCATTLWIS